MLCDRCKQNQATVHSVTIINGVKQEHYLCSECAKGAQYKVPSLMDILSGFYGAPQQIQQQSACACGSSMDLFQESGLLGCPDCYTSYRDELIPVIKRAQGGRLRHVGRRPMRLEPQEAAAAQQEEAKEDAKPQLSEVDRLKEELNKAVQEERFERAAELRDRIRTLEKGE